MSRTHLISSKQRQRSGNNSLGRRAFDMSIFIRIQSRRLRSLSLANAARSCSQLKVVLSTSRRFAGTFTMRRILREKVLVDCLGEDGTHVRTDLQDSISGM